MRVELVNPRVSAYQMTLDDGRELSGVSLKATGLVPADVTCRGAACGWG